MGAELPLSHNQHPGHFIRLRDTSQDAIIKTGRDQDGFYQINQLKLQKDMDVYLPEFYTALADPDPRVLPELLQFEFPATEKAVHIDAIERVEKAYEGEGLIVPFKPKNLVFTLASLKHAAAAAEFVASPCICQLQVGPLGEVKEVELAEPFPYFIYLFFTYPGSQNENSFNAYVNNTLKPDKIKMQDPSKDPVEELNMLFFNTVRNYFIPPRASSGRMFGLPFVSH